MTASEIIIAPKGTQMAIFLGKTAPPNIEIAAIGAKFAGWGKIRSITPMAIRLSATAMGKYLLFIGLFQLPGYFIAALCYVRAGADTGFPAIDIECPILWPVADDPVDRSYEIAE